MAESEHKILFASIDRTAAETPTEQRQLLSKKNCSKRYSIA